MSTSSSEQNTFIRARETPCQEKSNREIGSWYFALNTMSEDVELSKKATKNLRHQQDSPSQFHRGKTSLRTVLEPLTKPTDTERYERCVLTMSAKSRNKHFRKQHVDLLCIRAAQGNRGAKIQPNFFSQQTMNQGMRRSSTMSGSSKYEAAIKDGEIVPAGFDQSKGRVVLHRTAHYPPCTRPLGRFLTQLVMHIFSIHHPSHRRARRELVYSAIRCRGETLPF